MRRAVGVGQTGGAAAAAASAQADRTASGLRSCVSRVRGGALTLVYWIHAGLTWLCTRREYDIRIIFSPIDLWVTLSQTNPPGQGVNRVQEDLSLSLQLCFCF